MKFGAGQPVPRLEDDRLITGNGQFTDDLTLPGVAHMVLLRSPHAHAKLLEVDTLAAKSAPGIIAVFTNKDLAAAGIVMQLPTAAFFLDPSSSSGYVAFTKDNGPDGSI